MLPHENRTDEEEGCQDTQPLRSPPTERVVAVIELFAHLDVGPLTALEISRRCGISRSTCRAILATLEQAGWLERLSDGTYVTGLAMVATGAAITAQLPILRRAEIELRHLANELDCPCTFTRADRDQLTLLAQVGSAGRPGAGLAIGTRFPLQPPYGATIMARRPHDQQRHWVERAGLTAEQQEEWLAVLASIGRRGIGGWRPQPQDASVRDATLLLLQAVATEPSQPELHQRLVGLLAHLGDRALTDAELDGDGELPVGYLAAAAIDKDGTGYEIEIHVEQPAMNHQDRTFHIERLLAAADHISQMEAGGG